MSGLAPLAFGGFLLPLGVVILAIVAIAGGRAEPDPLHERPATLYLTAVSFFAVFVVLFAVFGLASSALNLTVDHNSYDSSAFRALAPGSTSRSCSTDSSGNTSCSDSGLGSTAPLIRSPGQHDGDYRDMVLALIAAILGAVLFAVHYRWLRRYLADRVDGPGLRVRHTYLYVACFFAVVVAVPAVGALLYDVVKVIAPGVTNAGTRGEALVSLGGTAVLATGAAILFLFHWNQSPLATSVGWTPFTPPPPPPPPPAAPPPPPPLPEEPAPAAPRKAVRATPTKKAGAVKKR